MTRQNLYLAVSKKLGISKRKAETAVDAVFKAIKKGVVSDKRVVINGFGVWEKRPLSAGVARNPQTGEPVLVSSRLRPWFRPSKELKQVVGG